MMDEPVYKSIEDLIAEGGRFYPVAGESWCDTPLDSWRLIPGKGYVKVTDDNTPIEVAKRCG